MKHNREEVIIKYLRSLIYRTMSVILLFLVLAILSKNSTNYKNIIAKNLYEKQIPFVKIKSLYQKYLGGLEPINKVIDKEEPVFNEEITFETKEKYHDGVKLVVSNNYLVPIISEGLVVYVGEKENYGNVIIIETLDNIDIWYGFIKNPAVKLYDYVKKGAFLGTTEKNYLFLAYQKDGEFLNYENYLK